MEPEGEAEGELDQERAEGEEDDEACGHEEAVEDGGEATLTRFFAVGHAGFGGCVARDACVAGCGFEVYVELAVCHVLSDNGFLAVCLEEG